MSATCPVPVEDRVDPDEVPYKPTHPDLNKVKTLPLASGLV